MEIESDLCACGSNDIINTNYSVSCTAPDPGSGYHPAIEELAIEIANRNGQRIVRAKMELRLSPVPQ